MVRSRIPPQNLLSWMLLFQLIFYSSSSSDSKETVLQYLNNKTVLPDLFNKDIYIGNDEIDSREIKTKTATNEPKTSMVVDLYKNHASIGNPNLRVVGNNSSLKGETTTPGGDTVLSVTLSVLLITITLGSIIGNAFVIAAILLERNLQSFQNSLTISLAVADLMVGLVVMPFGVYYQANKEWTLGLVLCDFWTSSDVLCCTASILNLVAIAFDRYWVVTNCANTRSTSRIITMIVAVWSVSLAVAVAPQFGWMDSDHLNTVLIGHECIPSLALGYQILSYSVTILIPLPVILFLYWKIYQTARKSFRWREEQRKAKLNMCRNSEGSKETSFGRGKTFILNKVKSTSTKDQVESTVPCEDLSSCSMAGTASGSGNSGSTNDSNLPLTSTTASTSEAQSTVKTPSSKKGSTRSTLRNPANKNDNCNQEIRRENKTAMILAIITGAFMVCWLPYFTLNFLTTRCGLKAPPEVFIVLGWLGYFNSTINPIIYTIFSPEFRKAFKRLLDRMRGSRNQRLNL